MLEALENTTTFTGNNGVDDTVWRDNHNNTNNTRLVASNHPDAIVEGDTFCVAVASCTEHARKEEYRAAFVTTTTTAVDDDKEGEDHRGNGSLSFAQAVLDYCEAFVAASPNERNRAETNNDSANLLPGEIQHRLKRVSGGYSVIVVPKQQPFNNNNNNNNNHPSRNTPRQQKVWVFTDPSGACPMYLCCTGETDGMPETIAVSSDRTCLAPLLSSPTCSTESIENSPSPLPLPAVSTIVATYLPLLLLSDTDDNDSVPGNLPSTAVPKKPAFHSDNNSGDNNNDHHDDWRIALYYCYIDISKPGLVQEHVDFHKQLCQDYQLNGRIRVSPEGINGVLSGRLEACETYERKLRDELRRLVPRSSGNGDDAPDAKDEEGTDWELDVKYCRLRTDLPVQRQLFDSLICKATSTVVSLFEPGYYADPSNNGDGRKHGFSKQGNRRKRRQQQRQEQQQQKLLEEACGDASSPVANLQELASMVPHFPGGQHLTPQEWNDKLSNASDDAIILDCRNVYESNVGYFQAPNAATQTLLTNTRKYSDLPKVLAQSYKDQDWSNKKQIFMYCTGGVRCEQASKFVQAMVTKDRQQQKSANGVATEIENCGETGVQVYQLHGGIQRYLEHFHDPSSSLLSPGKQTELQEIDGNGIKEPCLYRGLNFVFDPRRTDPMGHGNPESSNVVGKCCLCGMAHDDYDNGHAPLEEEEARCCKCRILVLVCSPCREKVLCWGEDHKEDLGLPKLYCGVDACSDYQSTGKNPVSVISSADSDVNYLAKAPSPRQDGKLDHALSNRNMIQNLKPGTCLQFLVTAKEEYNGETQPVGMEGTSCSLAITGGQRKKRQSSFRNGGGMGCHVLGCLYLCLLLVAMMNDCPQAVKAMEGEYDHIPSDETTELMPSQESADHRSSTGALQEERAERQQEFEIPREEVTAHRDQEQHQYGEQQHREHSLNPIVAADPHVSDKDFQKASPSEEEGSTDDNDGKEPSSAPLYQDDHGVLTLETHQSFVSALTFPKQHQNDRDKRESSGPPHGLLLVLLYSTSDECPTQQSPSWVTRLQQASDIVRNKSSATDDGLIQFGKLDTSQWKGAAEWLTAVGLETTPTLIFIVARNFEAEQVQRPAFLMDYIGPLENADDIALTVLQYYYRLFETSTTPETLLASQTAAAAVPASDESRGMNFRLLKPFSNEPHDFSAQIVPSSFDNLETLSNFWKQRQDMFQRLAQSSHDKPGGVHPKWDANDAHYIHWLLNTGDKHQPLHANTLTLLVQCQSPLPLTPPAAEAGLNSTDAANTAHEWYVTFAEMAWVLSSRRDVWFLAIHQRMGGEEQMGCLAGEGGVLRPGQVAAFQLPATGPWHEQHLTWQQSHVLSPAWQKRTLQHQQKENGGEKEEASREILRRYLIDQSTPDVLWFDRRATAPIAFADSKKVHFILLVNFIPLRSELDRYDERIQHIIHDFHNACAKRKQDISVDASDDAICLIVPSTETRVLTSFGIDIWTPLDQRATSSTTSTSTGGSEEEAQSKTASGVPPKFPTLLITDRRPQVNLYRDGITTTTHGVRRYYLNPPDVFQPHAISHFFKDFKDHQLVPALRSSTANKDEDSVNAYGVTSLTGLEFQQRFQTSATSTEHALVLFTTPSCGHCKRLHFIYNQVSSLIQELKWDQHMSLYKIDVSQNEVHKMSLPWLPDVYYFPPSLTEDATSLPVAPVRYDIVNDMGDGIGRISDPIDIIEWWLDVMVGEGDWIDPDVLLSLLDDSGIIDDED